MIEIIRLIRILLELGRDILREHKSNEHDKEMHEIADDVRGHLRTNYRVRDNAEVPDNEPDV